MERSHTLGGRDDLQAWRIPRGLLSRRRGDCDEDNLDD